MDKNSLCSNMDELQGYLRIFEEDMANRKQVDTPFGMQDVKSGYQIKSISLLEGFANVEVFMKDRQIKENDEYLRGGDETYFTIKDKKVYSYEEWEAYCEEKERGR